MRILLMGFMGCGKSTLGKLLSEELSLEFIDLDELIEKKGENYFRNAEGKYLEKILRKDNIVIAAGGGTPCYLNNMERINEKTISFYLKVSTAKLYQRLLEKNLKKNRPLLKSLSSKKELMNFIKTKLQEREKFYSMANYTINTGQKSKKKIAEEIVSYVR